MPSLKTVLTFLAMLATLALGGIVIERSLRSVFQPSEPMNRILSAPLYPSVLATLLALDEFEITADKASFQSNEPPLMAMEAPVKPGQTNAGLLDKSMTALFVKAKEIAGIKVPTPLFAPTAMTYEGKSSDGHAVQITVVSNKGSASTTVAVWMVGDNQVWTQTFLDRVARLVTKQPAEPPSSTPDLDPDFVPKMIVAPPERIAPVEPVAPRELVAPVEPVAPREPAAPVGPVAPPERIAPVEPVAPPESVAGSEEIVPRRRTRVAPPAPK